MRIVALEVPRHDPRDGVEAFHRLAAVEIAHDEEGEDAGRSSS